MLLIIPNPISMVVIEISKSNFAEISNPNFHLLRFARSTAQGIYAQTNGAKRKDWKRKGENKNFWL